jgi:hypothetical protein
MNNFENHLTIEDLKHSSSQKYSDVEITEFFNSIDEPPTEIIINDHNPEKIIANTLGQIIDATIYDVKESVKKDFVNGTKRMNIVNTTLRRFREYMKILQQEGLEKAELYAQKELK